MEKTLSKKMLEEMDKSVEKDIISILNFSDILENGNMLSKTTLENVINFEEGYTII